MSGVVELELYLEHTTGAAFLLSDGRNKDWVPRAAIRNAEDLADQEGTEVTVTISEALAISKGFV